jgi:3-oxoacyl-[acyl-carrier protein] reductase
VPTDLAEPEVPRRVVEATLEELGQIDVLANNAAHIRNGPLEAHSIEDFDVHYAVNVRGPRFLARTPRRRCAAARDPAIRRRSGDPAILNVSSSVGSMVKSGTMLCGSSKAALEYLTRASAYELAADGIRVNCIVPGPVDIPHSRHVHRRLEAAYGDLARRIPLDPNGERPATSRFGSGSSLLRRPLGQPTT